MKCEAERLRLAAIQLGRNEALLRELMEKEKALREIERLKKTIFDWADLRRAAHEVLHWEALYDEAQTTLKLCIEGTKGTNNRVKPTL